MVDSKIVVEIPRNSGAHGSRVVGLFDAAAVVARNMLHSPVMTERAFPFAESLGQEELSRDPLPVFLAQRCGDIGHRASAFGRHRARKLRL